MVVRFLRLILGELRELMESSLALLAGELRTNASGPECIVFNSFNYFYSFYSWLNIDFKVSFSFHSLSCVVDEGPLCCRLVTHVKLAELTGVVFSP